MVKKKTTYYLTQRADDWLKEQSEIRGISKNDVIQELINKAMESEATR